MTLATTAVLMTAAGVVGVWAAFALIRRRVLGRGQVLALMALEVALVVQAAAALIGLAAGHDASEPGTHAAYLAGSLLVLPLLVGVPVRLGFPPAPGAPGADPQFIGGIEVNPGGEDRSADRFRAAAAVLGCLAVVVVLSRMWVTWKAGGG